MSHTVCTKTGCENRGYTRQLCTRHYKQFRLRRLEQRLWVTGRVPSEPVVAHANTLRSHGIGYRRIGEIAGVTPQTVRIMHRQPTVHANTAALILAIPVPEIPHHLVADHAMLNPVGSARRVRALVAIGYTQEYLAEQIGMFPTAFSRIVHMRHEHVLACTARRVDDLYQSLHMTPGPSAFARRFAARHGWAAPMAWDVDTIDDPTAQPHTGGSVVPPSFVQRYQEYVDLGYRDDRVIAQRMGITIGSLERMLYRQGAQPQRIAS